MSDYSDCRFVVEKLLANLSPKMSRIHLISGCDQIEHGHACAGVFGVSLLLTFQCWIFLCQAVRAQILYGKSTLCLSWRC